MNRRFIQPPTRDTRSTTPPSRAVLSLESLATGTDLRLLLPRLLQLQCEGWEARVTTAVTILNPAHPSQRQTCLGRPWLMGPSMARTRASSLRTLAATTQLRA